MIQQVPEIQVDAQQQTNQIQSQTVQDSGQNKALENILSIHQHTLAKKIIQRREDYKIYHFPEKLRRQIFSQYEQTECTICIDSFTPNSVCKQVMMCEHIFHSKCLDFWLDKKPRCPNCQNLVNQAAIESWKETGPAHYDYVFKSLKDSKLLRNKSFGETTNLKHPKLIKKSVPIKSKDIMIEFKKAIMVNTNKKKENVMINFMREENGLFPERKIERRHSL